MIANRSVELLSLSRLKPNSSPPVLYTPKYGVRYSDSPHNSSIIRPFPHQFTNHVLLIGHSPPDAASPRRFLATGSKAWRFALLQKEAEGAGTMRE
jgi:hypothetical protein